MYGHSLYMFWSSYILRIVIEANDYPLVVIDGVDSESVDGLRR